MGAIAGAGAEQVVARRHLLAAVVVDVPAGHGRSSLLRSALADPPPGCVDVVIAAPQQTISPSELAGAVERALGRSPGVDGDPVDRMRAALASGIAAEQSEVVLVIDELHRAGPEALAAVGALAATLPAHGHLLIGGAGLASLSLGPMVAEGIAVRVGPTLLPMDVPSDEGVLAEVLAHARRLDLTAPARALLDLVVALDQRSSAAVAAMAEAMGEPGAIGELVRLPLVAVGTDHLVADERWRLACEVPDDDLLRRGASAAGRVALDHGALAEAGHLAVEGRDPDLLRAVVRRALATQPPAVGAHDLRVWQGAQVLAPTDPHAWWLDAVCLAVLQGDLRAAFDRYRAVAAAFREAGDLDGELAAGSSAAVLARRLDDVGALLAFIGRAGEMVAEGHAAAMGPALLGEALVAQLGGDHAGAVEALSRLPGDALVGDWAAQVAMVRGTNLLLLDRSEEAIEQLVAATGWSGAWSSARALELLAQARWRAGDAVGALDDLRAAEELAASVAAADLVTSVRSCRAVMATVAGRHDAPELVARVDERGPLEGEALRMATIARVLAAVDGGDLAGARALLATVDPVPRALASTHWCIALQVALGEATPDAWAPVVADHPALRGPLAAGIAGLRHLDEGAPIERPHHRYLPSSWCAGAVSVVEICLLGVPSIRRDGRVVEHAAWERARVRELAARLALVGPSARDQIAADLWPDLDGPAAARNLRVNLTHLLDAIDPDRPKGEGSRWVVDRSGAFGFADDDTLRIDVREVERSARAIVAAASLEDDPAVVAAARRFIRHRDGPLLGGAALGAWVEPYEQAWETLSLRAVSLAGEAALRVGDPRLAEDLGRRGLRADPWAERLHQLVVRACLARDDLDAARRELRRAAAALAELGVRPEPATWSLARLVGMRLDA